MKAGKKLASTVYVTVLEKSYVHCDFSKAVELLTWQYL